MGEPMTDAKKEYPPRVFIDVLDFNIGVTTHIEDSVDAEERLRREQYISIIEHEELLREARAEVWEEVAREFCNDGQSIYDDVTFLKYLKIKAKAARSME